MCCVVTETVSVCAIENMHYVCMFCFVVSVCTNTQCVLYQCVMFDGVSVYHYMMCFFTSLFCSVMPVCTIRGDVLGQCVVLTVVVYTIAEYVFC